MHCIYRTSDRTQAQLLRGALEAEGVATYVQGEHLFGLQGEIPAGAAFELRICIIDSEQKPKAEHLLREWLADRSQSDTDAAWTCETCGETHEPQFVTCWRCDTDVSDSE